MGAMRSLSQLLVCISMPLSLCFDSEELSAVEVGTEGQVKVMRKEASSSITNPGAESGMLFEGAEDWLKAMKDSSEDSATTLAPQAQQVMPHAEGSGLNDETGKQILNALQGLEGSMERLLQSQRADHVKNSEILASIAKHLQDSDPVAQGSPSSEANGSKLTDLEAEEERVQADLKAKQKELDEEMENDTMANKVSEQDRVVREVLDLPHTESDLDPFAGAGADGKRNGGDGDNVKEDVPGFKVGGVNSVVAGIDDRLRNLENASSQQGQLAKKVEQLHQNVQTNSKKIKRTLDTLRSDVKQDYGNPTLAPSQRQVGYHTRKDEIDEESNDTDLDEPDDTNSSKKTRYDEPAELPSKSVLVILVLLGAVLLERTYSVTASRPSA
eukprot:TRINITY_DN32780_c0_g1_i1.p1 TRINITY_DN32780_c0_g1~~TRINITY_DN32780_c0_g1_i1.p1  ORF type:complete len:385 (-),score=84.14 TRINITY_DN32780_c0_g1_i1:111-1265(-)